MRLMIVSLIALIASFPSPGNAQQTRPEDQETSPGNAQQIPPGDQETVNRLVRALKAGDKAGVASLLSYPVERIRPLAPLKDAQDFIANFDDFFDSTTTPVVIDSARHPREVQGLTELMSRGAGVGGTGWSGTLDIRSGIIVRLYVLTKGQKRKQKSAVEPIPPEDEETIEEIVAALRTRNKKALAALMDYPVERPYPLASLENERDFVANFDDYFDSATIPLVIEAAKKPTHTIAWRWYGTHVEAALENSSGSVTTSVFLTLNEGKVTKLEAETDGLKRKIAEAKARESAGLHPSVRDYERVLIECSTQKFHIRIFRDKAGQIRYAAWKRAADLRTKPELLLSGESRYNPAMWGHNDHQAYAFKNGDHQYAVFSPGVCSDPETDCLTRLTVSRGEKILLQDACR